MTFSQQYPARSTSVLEFNLDGQLDGELRRCHYEKDRYWFSAQYRDGKMHGAFETSCRNAHKHFKYLYKKESLKELSLEIGIK